MDTGTGSMVRIALFIDGGYLDEVSTFYKYQHWRNARISLEGLQKFVRFKVAELEKRDPLWCHIIESHYFRGRFPAARVDAAGKLKDQAAFDDVLIKTGITPHYLPIFWTAEGTPKEKGIDVWLSLEAYDLAVHKGYDVLALMGCDGDYVPLVRKLASIGIRSLVLAWDFEYAFDDGSGKQIKKEVKTAQALLAAATYPVRMGELIENGLQLNNEVVESLFVGASGSWETNG
jgi:hypothetical protein